MSYNLFLDDLRHPKDACVRANIDDSGKKDYVNDGNYIVSTLKQTLLSLTNTKQEDWEIVRTYEQFVDIIKLRKLPGIVSFDHDLHEEHMKHYFDYSTIYSDVKYDQLKHKTGMHCAEFIVDYIKSHPKSKIPTMFIHSANKFGSRNIRAVLKDYIKY